MKRNRSGIKKLKTPFFNEGMADIPWNIYPRPQMKRNSFFCLNGAWDFEIKRDKNFPHEYSRKINAPFPP